MHNSLIPNLMVNDVVETAFFYQDILGFQLVVGVADFEKEMGGENLVFELTKGSKIDWVNLKLDPKDKNSAEFMFQSRKSLEADIPALEGVAIGASQTLYLRTHNADEQHNSLKDKVEVIQEPITKPYGMREWYLKDPNGYILCFGQELSQ